MLNYDPTGCSDIESYSYDETTIRVRYRSGWRLTFTDRSVGTLALYILKTMADSGKGLGEFIKNHVSGCIASEDFENSTGAIVEERIARQDDERRAGVARWLLNEESAIRLKGRIHDIGLPSYPEEWPTLKEDAPSRDRPSWRR